MERTVYDLISTSKKIIENANVNLKNARSPKIKSEITNAIEFWEDIYWSLCQLKAYQDDDPNFSIHRNKEKKP